ncbi:MAG: RelA/SpoT domain-containing protein [bacterium]
MSWVKLEYSKKQVRRSGDYLISEQNDLDIKMFMNSFDVLSNWRSSHAYPMQSMIGYIRKKSFDVDDKAIIVQRLKRTPSILSKLERERGMKLDRMEDIAGCRIVVSNKAAVYAVRENIVNGRTRNILRRERDYIKNPKDSGYRGIHLIYRYNGAKKYFSNHSVELQIRSKIQHSWATAVEVVGTFTKQDLKASKGHDDWLIFFKLASIAFADVENQKLAKNVGAKERVELIKYIEKLGVIDRLRAFAVSTKHLGKISKSKGEYFLLKLDIEKSNINIRGYASNDLSQAIDEYAKLETEFKGDTTKDVVLVSASSVRGLKKAYPNYFADTTEFMKTVDKLIEANKKSS